LKKNIKWSAPEVLFKDKISSKADVWSFGVVMFEIFSKGEITSTKSNEQVADSLRNGEIMPLPPYFSDNIEEIISKCWKQEPKERPTFKVKRK